MLKTPSVTFHHPFSHYHSDFRMFVLQRMMIDIVPLCSAQYERAFNTTRIPGEKSGLVCFRAAIYNITIP